MATTERWGSVVIDDGNWVGGDELLPVWSSKSLGTEDAPRGLTDTLLPRRDSHSAEMIDMTKVDEYEQQEVIVQTINEMAEENKAGTTDNDYYKIFRRYLIETVHTSPEEADKTIEEVKANPFDYTEWRRTQDWYEDGPEDMHEYFKTHPEHQGKGKKI